MFDWFFGIKWCGDCLCFVFGVVLLGCGLFGICDGEICCLWCGWWYYGLVGGWLMWDLNEVWGILFYGVGCWVCVLYVWRWFCMRDL